MHLVENMHSFKLQHKYERQISQDTEKIQTLLFKFIYLFFCLFLLLYVIVGSIFKY